MPKPVPTVEDRPYMVLRPHGEPIYKPSFKSAKDVVYKHLNDFKDTFLYLQATDAVAAILDLEDVVGRITEDGGRVSGIIDPMSGMKYTAEIVKRKELS